MLNIIIKIKQPKFLNSYVCVFMYNNFDILFALTKVVSFIVQFFFIFVFFAIILISIKLIPGKIFGNLKKKIKQKNYLKKIILECISLVDSTVRFF